MHQAWYFYILSYKAFNSNSGLYCTAPLLANDKSMQLDKVQQSFIILEDTENNVKLIKWSVPPTPHTHTFFGIV